jgi:hypothetical protein
LRDTRDSGARGIRETGLPDVLRAAGETETTQENIHYWLQLDEGDPGFRPLTEEVIAAGIFIIYFHQHCLYFLNFLFICFLIFLFVFRGYLLLH